MPNIIEIIGNKNTLTIDWLIHSVCNYKCKYCIVNDGKYPFPDLETTKKTIDKISAHYNDKQIVFQISGGEPTVWKEFPLLVEHIYTKHNTKGVDLVTNGSVSDKYWQKLDYPRMKVIFSHHYEEIKDLNKFIESYNGCKASHKKIVMSMIPEHFDKIIDHYNIIRNLFPNDPITVKALDNRHQIPAGVQKSLLSYSNEQLAIIGSLNETHSNKYTYSTVIYDDGSSDFIEPFSMLVNDKNNFFGWECNIGLEKLVFHYNGIIKRANCQPNTNSYGNWLNNDLSNLPITPYICNKQRCTAATEICVSKKR